MESSHSIKFHHRRLIPVGPQNRLVIGEGFRPPCLGFERLPLPNNLFEFFLPDGGQVRRHQTGQRFQWGREYRCHRLNRNSQRRNGHRSVHLQPSRRCQLSWRRKWSRWRKLSRRYMLPRRHMQERGTLMGNSLRNNQTGQLLPPDRNRDRSHRKKEREHHPAKHRTTPSLIAQKREPLLKTGGIHGDGTNRTVRLSGGE
jgi:hypothetical protein